MEGNRLWDWDSWESVDVFEEHWDFDGTQPSEKQMGCDETKKGWLWSLPLQNFMGFFF